MICPICEGDTTVAYTVKDVDAIHRRRVCKACNYAFYTTELELKTSHADFRELFKTLEKRYKK